MPLPVLDGFWLLPPRDSSHQSRESPYGSRQQFIWTHNNASLTLLPPSLGGVLSGGLVLQRSGRTRLGISFLLILAVPGVLVGLFFLAMIIINPRWN
jgi:hypothetical protein